MFGCTIHTSDSVQNSSKNKYKSNKHIFLPDLWSIVWLIESETKKTQLNIPRAAGKEKSVNICKLYT